MGSGRQTCQWYGEVVTMNDNEADYTREDHRQVQRVFTTGNHRLINVALEEH